MHCKHLKKLDSVCRFVSINLHTLFFVFVLLLPATIHAQKAILSGYVKSLKTGEVLSNGAIYINDAKSSTKVNSFGYYSVVLSKGNQRIIVFCSGYKTLQKDINITKDSTIVFELPPLEYDIEEIKIVAANTKTLSDKHGNFSIDIEQIKKIPALFGEIDLLKAMQVLPGVQQGTEGTSGIYVHGGSPDQTLILIDGVPVYNAYHLFGFFSVFNPEAVSRVSLYKNDLPAQYGGRLSAVLDIETKEGNRKKMQRSFAISPISGKFTIEGPIGMKKDSTASTSFIISGRKTWIDVITSGIQKISGQASTIGYGFYDTNFKINHIFKNKSQLYFSFYAGRDAFNNSYKSNNATSVFQYNWGNYTSIVRWNQVINQRLFQNTTLSYTGYQYNLINKYSSDNSKFSSQYTSSIKDIQIKTDWDYFTKPNSTIKFGIGYTSHYFQPEVKESTGDFAPTVSSENNNAMRVDDIQGYVQKNIKVGSNLNFNVGVHSNILLVDGQVYKSLQPRTNLVWAIKPNTTIRASFFDTYQYLHLLTNSSLGLPTDLWVPITKKAPPEKARQISIGIGQEWRGFNVSLDGYYKKMSNLIDYKEGATFLNDELSQWDEKITTGSGTSKGIEMFIHKNKGATQGFVSYTLSWTNRQFLYLNNGLEFPYKYDRRHVLSANFSHQFNKNKELSCNFSLQSGSLLSLPVARYKSVLPPAGNLFTIPTYGSAENDFYKNLGYLPQVNNFRLPAYHRLDINYQTTKKMKNKERKWIFSIYNLYNHANPFFIYYETRQLKQFSLLPILPSISYELKY